MSFLTTVTEELLAAQGQLEAINANLAAQNAGAAAATTVVAPAAADSVSIQQAAIFSAFGTAYQTTAADAQTQLEAYATNLGTSSTSYSDTEANNAASALMSDADQFSLLSDPVSQVQAAGPGTTALDWLQYLLGGTGNYTNSAMLGGMFGLSSNAANILNIGAGNWSSAASNLIGMAGGGLLPAASDTIGDAAAAAGAADLAASTSPAPVGMGGAMPVAAGIGQGTLVGKLSVPPSWVGGQVTPVVGTAAAPLHTVGWTAAAPQAGTGSVIPGMPGMVTGAGRASSGFGAPRYGVKPIIMPKSTAV